MLKISHERDESRMITLTPIQSAACEYYHHHDGIHEFRFTLPSREAVDIWLAYMEGIYEQAADRNAVRLLIDIRQSGLLPMTYMFSRVKQWVSQYPERRNTYLALLHGKNGLASVVRPYLRLLGVEDAYHLHFFEERADAMDWLENPREAA
jgi:hypothetical protein